MKPLLTSIIILSLYVTGLCQPSKKDTKIIVALDTTGKYNELCLKLYDVGFSLDKKDPEFKFIETGEKSIGSRSIKIRAIVKDSIIVFSGLVANDVTISLYGAKAERTFSEIYFGGMKGRDLRIAWEYLDNFAKQFGAVKYSK